MKIQITTSDSMLKTMLIKIIEHARYLNKSGQDGYGFIKDLDNNGAFDPVTHAKINQALYYPDAEVVVKIN